MKFRIRLGNSIFVNLTEGKDKVTILAWVVFLKDSWDPCEEATSSQNECALLDHTTVLALTTESRLSALAAERFHSFFIAIEI